MAKILLSIGTINLVDDNGKQKIEIVPNSDIDLIELIRTWSQPEQRTTVPCRTNLAVYLESLLSTLELPVTIHHQKTYSGLRSGINNNTLMYWNYNTRCQYINISFKSSLMLCVKQLAFSIDTDTRFPRTSRIRLTSKEEINTLFEPLSFAINTLEHGSTIK